jgi:hypothetical protein
VVEELLDVVVGHSLVLDGLTTVLVLGSDKSPICMVDGCAKYSCVDKDFKVADKLLLGAISFKGIKTLSQKHLYVTMKSTFIYFSLQPFPG